MIEIFLSTDGKHTVRISPVDGMDPKVLAEAYALGRKFFNKILEDYPGTKMGNAIEKADKESKLGVCDKCGAPMAWSNKSNKPYCSALCWKNQGGY